MRYCISMVTLIWANFWVAGWDKQINPIWWWPTLIILVSPHLMSWQAGNHDKIHGSLPKRKTPSAQEMEVAYAASVIGTDLWEDILEAIGLIDSVPQVTIMKLDDWPLPLHHVFVTVGYLVQSYIMMSCGEYATGVALVARCTNSITN